MIPFLYISIFLGIIYAVLMSLYVLGWRRLRELDIPPEWSPSSFVTVLIAARNEAETIENCLRSISSGTFPLSNYEIIVVDDHSEDATGDCVRRFARNNPGLSLTCLELKQTGLSGKKNALSYGLSKASGDIMVTTDADCVVGPNWLRCLVFALEKGDKKMLTGPVQFHQERNSLQRFQSLDLMGMMGITGAGIELGFQRMGNGSNMAYQKGAFLSVKGYEGNENQASGDDMFLLQKIEKQYPGSVGFVKHPDALVSTEAMPDLKSFIQQRLRWGTKNKGLQEWPIRLALLSVFLFCWTLLIQAVWLIISMLLNREFPVMQLLVCGILIALKALSDYVLLRMMCRYFKRQELLKSFPLSFVLHTAYIALLGLGSLLFRSYTWKGRGVV